MTRCLVLAFLLAGCSAYQLGGPKAAFSRIEVAPIRNSTSRPGTHAVLQGKLVEALDADPRIKVGPGEALLSTEVTQYRREGFTTKSGDAYTFTSYRVTFVVRCTLTTGQRTLFKNREFTGTRRVASLEEAARVLRLEKSSMEKPGAEKSVAEDEETGNDDGDMGGDAGAGPTTPFGSAARRMVRSASGSAVATKDPEVLLRRAQASARRLRRELCARRMQSAWRANVAKKKLLGLRVAKRQAESNQ